VGEQKQKMLEGELYISTDPELAEERAACRRLLDRLNSTHAVDSEATHDILAELLGGIGDTSAIQPPFFCDYGYNIRIGSGCFLNFGVTILDCAPVHIGDDVQIGPSTLLAAAGHPTDPDERRAGFEFARPIVIEDGAWLGAGVIVAPGITVGADSVVGAGSVVVGDVPPLSICAGNPCRVIRQL
jgi:maltose O-acetyltransferase